FCFRFFFFFFFFFLKNYRGEMEIEKTPPIGKKRGVKNGNNNTADYSSHSKDSSGTVEHPVEVFVGDPPQPSHSRSGSSMNGSNDRNSGRGGARGGGVGAGPQSNLNLAPATAPAPTPSGGYFMSHEVESYSVGSGGMNASSVGSYFDVGNGP